MFGFSPNCVNESTDLDIAVLFVKLRCESKSQEILLSIWPVKRFGKISQEALLSAFFMFYRYHRVLKTHKVYLENTTKAYKDRHYAKAHGFYDLHHCTCAECY